MYNFFRMKRQKITEHSADSKIPKTSGPGGCSFWNSKKDRFCKMVAKKGLEFCGQHLPADDGRVKCQHCQSSIQQSRLENHLKKCNILKEKSIIPKYYVKGWFSFFKFAKKCLKIVYKIV